MAKATWPPWTTAAAAGLAAVLGVAAARLVLGGAAFALDDPRLSAGRHAAEPDLRWTDGDAAPPIAGGRVLELWTAPLEHYWRAPRRTAQLRGTSRTGT